MNAAKLYRPAAWNAYQRGDEVGSVLALEGTSTRVVFHVVVVALLAALAFVLCFPVKDNVRARGFVRASGARTTTSVAAGAVERVLVRPGSVVTAGQTVIELSRATEAAELDRATQELEGLWTRLLRDPLDREARDAIVLRGPEVRRARSRVEERTVRAPISGVLTDVRVQEGRHVAAGDTLFVVEPEGAAIEIVAVLPGALRPQIDLETRARFAVDGADATAPVTLREIASDAVGPDEVKRLLGPALQDSVAPTGMSFAVTATVDGREFRRDGNVYRLYQGMGGDLDVSLDDKPILFLLVPALRRWVNR